MDTNLVPKQDGAAQIWTGVYTLQGLTLLAKLHSGTALQVTRVVAGAGKVPLEELASQTAVSDPRMEFTRGTVTIKPDGLARLPVQLINVGVLEGFSLWQTGVYALDPDEGEILYCILQSSHPDYIPTERQMPGFVVNIGLNLIFGNSDKLTAEIDPEGFVTNYTLELRLEHLDPAHALLRIAHGLGCYPSVELGALTYGAGLGRSGETPAGGTDMEMQPVKVIHHDPYSLSVRTIKPLTKLGEPVVQRVDNYRYIVTFGENDADSLYIQLSGGQASASPPASMPDTRAVQTIVAQAVGDHNNSQNAHPGLRLDGGNL